VRDEPAGARVRGRAGGGGSAVRLAPHRASHGGGRGRAGNARMTLPSIRIASYNIHGCVGGDGRFDPGRVARVIGELDADVVACKEVESRRMGVNTLRLLARETGYDAIAGPTVRGPQGDYGNGLLT